MMTQHDAWMAGALCRQIGTAAGDIWYPEKGRNVRTTARNAKEFCHQCRVKNRCLDYALAYDEQWGIWGAVNFGQTRKRDRDQMREERGIRQLETIERTDTFLVCLGDKRRNRAKKDPA